MKMVVSVNMVLEKYASILNGNISYPDADRWTWEMMQLFDDGKLQFEPKENENVIWELIQYLYGIDVPDIEDRTKSARKNIDIIDFLKEKGVYKFL